ncbi:carbohydrate sulfotransferase 1-like [Glandiceps talaboti]
MAIKSRPRVYGFVIATVVFAVAIAILALKSKHKVTQLTALESTVDTNTKLHYVSEISTGNTAFTNQQLNDILYRETHFQQILNFQDAYNKAPKPFDTRQYFKVAETGNPLSLVLPVKTKGTQIEKPDVWDFLNADKETEENKPIDHDSNKDGTVNVIIVTNRRSGSSFLGQIFNQNPDFFFHFEPVKVLESILGYQQLQPNVSKFLGNIFKCNFQGIPSLVDFYNEAGLHRASSKILISEPFCSAFDVSRKSVKKCDDIDIRMITDICKKVKNVAVKVIRVVNIQSLQALMADDTLNVKIIHLVRDPRAIYSSRVKAEKLAKTFDSEQEMTMLSLCKRMKHNYDTAHAHPQWLKNRYMLVRYEDLAENPIRVAKQMYNFIGIEKLPKSVKSWIAANSNADPEKSDVYSTRRNSSSVVQAWRLELPFDIVQRIDSMCSELMDALGYNLASVPSDLTNMTIDIFRSLPAV